MALSAPSTPRQMYATPRRAGRNQMIAQTPECFARVTVETPVQQVSGAAKRRSSRDKLDQEKNLTVAVRIRPMNARELACVSSSDIVRVDANTITIRGFGGVNNSTLDHTFHYDHVFCSRDEEAINYSDQEDVFHIIGLPLLQSAFKGYNACLFAYGQTGSGKSYSMMGSSALDITVIDSNTGVIPRFCKELFVKINSLPADTTATVEIGYFEIYNEKIHDLLAIHSGANRTALKVREHPNWGPYVVDLSVHNVTSYDDIQKWLQLGNKNRATAATAMNEKSSRSHSIFSIEIALLEGTKEDGSSRRSKVSLVDLAGSERLANSASNDERMKQGVFINKSLLTLGKVISSLAENKRGNQFVPYRDSVLTWLLRESLGGNSLTAMLATITPASSNVDETLATLRYACQARSIVNRARVNESPHDKLIRELRAEVERLRAIRQGYERSSIGSLSNLSDSSQHEYELDELRSKLSATEQKLEDAQTAWERRYVDNREEQLRELVEAEKRREELESRIRVLKKSDSDVNLSPYKTNFLEELEGVLIADENKENVDGYQMDKADVCAVMKDIYKAMDRLKATAYEENLQHTFDKLSNRLHAFENKLIGSLVQRTRTKKTVTFKN